MEGEMKVFGVITLSWCVLAVIVCLIGAAYSFSIGEIGEGLYRIFLVFVNVILAIFNTILLKRWRK